MHLLITGGAGFVGANLVRRLLADAASHQVVVIDDLSTGDRRNLTGLDADLRVATILDPPALTDAMSGADAVVHLAAIPSVPRSVRDPLASHEANATGTLRVLEAARSTGCGHVILASSSSVYGAHPELPKHEGLRPAPMSPYAASKLAGESYARAYATCYGLDVLAFRFFNIFGPLQPAGHAYAAVVPAFVDAALAGRPLPLEGDGTQTRDFTYVATVTEVITNALVRRVSSPDPVNLAFGTRTSLRELIGLLEEAVGHALEVEDRPTRPGDVPHSQADNTRLRTLFPDVVPVDLATGLAATIAWFRSQGAGSA